ncbi:MAG: helix-turn-helix domain-containing protein [Patescibacteria group bacterium]
MIKLEHKLRDLLLKAGLSESEMLVYLDLVNKPASTKWALVSRTGLNRNSVYRAFDRLKELDLVRKSADSVKALSIVGLANYLDKSRSKLKKLAGQLRNIAGFLKVDAKAFDQFEILSSQNEILDAYIMMSEVKYGTCLDFGDLENFVPVLGGMDPVFKFRQNRFNQKAKNLAICTTLGPYTQCMLRKNDLQKFKSNIERLDIDFKDKWIIFSDTNDHIMFNDFADKENPTSVLVKSKVVADMQRMQFSQFANQVEK